MLQGRSPRGERGLKCKKKNWSPSADGGRSPRGERGLKCFFEVQKIFFRKVALLAESVD